ncbi:MAG TPA: DUF4307 domain-containing protein [Dermatophilaceae bacterium]|nr:DUF4307 domain-containing protein [Dermatophilaceae bacterium]
MDSTILSLPPPPHDEGPAGMPLPRPAAGTTRWWVVGGVGCLLAVAAIVWFGITTTVGQVRAEVTAYDVRGDDAIVVEYDVHRPAGTAVRCAVTALDSRHGRVGTLREDIAASGPTSVHRVVTVRTGARAVTGVVESCVRLGS